MKDRDALLERIAERLKALADPMRLKILHALERGELCVTDLVAEVGGSQANISKHLAILRRAGLVECRRSGLFVLYRVADRTSLAICRTVCDVLERQAAAEHREIRRARGAAAGGPA